MRTMSSISNYLTERIGLTGAELEVVACATHLTAKYGTLLPYSYIGEQLNIDAKSVGRLLKNAVNRIWNGEKIHSSPGWMYWGGKPTVERFIYVMTAEVIQAGCLDESEFDGKVNHIIGNFFTPSELETEKEFHGFQIIREYVKDVVLDMDITANPGKWLKSCRGKNSSAESEVNAFINLIFSKTRISDTRGLLDIEPRIHTCTFLRRLRNWAQDEFYELIA